LIIDLEVVLILVKKQEGVDNLIKSEVLEITSTKLDLVYVFQPDTSTGVKHKLSTKGRTDSVLRKKVFANKHNVEQQYIDWAHNDIASELQGVIDCSDTIMEIRIWNKSD